MPEVADIEQLPVSQARAGEPAAWDALFRRYQLPLYVYAFELVRDEQAGLDIVQETFIAAVKHHWQPARGREDSEAGFSASRIRNASNAGANGGKFCSTKFPNRLDEFEDGPDDLLIRRESGD